MSFTTQKQFDLFIKQKGLSVGGSLDLRGTPITALPEGLSVGGWLDLSGTPITALPEGLSVGGSLDLRGTPITALPEGLSVGGWLDLSDTPITALPEGLSVGGLLYLRGTPITAGIYGNIIVPDGHSDGEYSVIGKITSDSVRIAAGCFEGDLNEARKRARGRTNYVAAINRIEQMFEAKK